MTNVAEPRLVALQDQEPSTGSLVDRELTSLVRRWMAAGSRAPERVRRETVLRVAPEPEVERTAAPDEVVDSSAPPLPRRGAGLESEQVCRTALLVDARRVPAEAAAGLLARIAERGLVNVCRAYGDWSTPELGEWAGRLRREGLHSFHHFSDEDDRALVALAIDAVDIARDTAVDEVVIAGDLTSVLPLVHRLHGAGVRVVAVGAAHTPHDVRAACDEFIDTSSIVDGALVVPAGRHRA
jgi:hypothetical protein